MSHETELAPLETHAAPASQPVRHLLASAFVFVWMVGFFLMYWLMFDVLNGYPFENTNNIALENSLYFGLRILEGIERFLMNILTGMPTY